MMEGGGLLESTGVMARQIDIHFTNLWFNDLFSVLLHRERERDIDRDRVREKETETDR